MGIIKFIFAVIAGLTTIAVVAFYSVMKSAWGNRKQKISGIGNAIAKTKTRVTQPLLFVLPMQTKYAVEIAAILETKLRELGLKNERDFLFSRIEVSGTQKSSISCSRVLAAIQKNSPKLVITIGSDAAFAMKEVNDHLQEADVVPHVFVAIRRNLAKELVGSLTPNSLRGPIAGVMYTVNEQKRIEFLISVLAPKRIAFLTNKTGHLDDQVFNEVKKAIEQFYPEIEIERILVSENSSIENYNFETLRSFDVLMGWFFLHKNFDFVTQNSPIPVLGGGAVDARMGAFAALSDDERLLADLLISNILFPHIFQNKPLCDLLILAPDDVVENYNPNVYISSSKIRRFNLSIPRKIRKSATFYE